jgi:hypothetical protein
MALAWTGWWHYYGREASTRYDRSAYVALAWLVLNMAAVQIGGAGVEGLVTYWEATVVLDMTAVYMWR